MSVMTASGSSSRQPHDIPLPLSPEKPISQRNSKKRKKGKEKEKEKEGNAPPGRRVGQDEWDHTRAGTEPWQFVSLTDSSASKHPPIFTKDGSYFFAVIGPSIKIHSCATGQVVSTLTGKPDSSRSTANTNIITTAILNPNNPFQLITGSLDGLIRVWDFLDAVLLQTISIEQPIIYLCAHEKFSDYVFVAVAKQTKKLNSNGREKEANGVVLRVSLKPRGATSGHKIQTSSEITSIGKTRAVVGLSFSPSGSWLVAVAGHKAYVAPTSSFKSGFMKYVSPEALTCLAFHPSEDYFATGDDKGNIRLWYCLNEQVVANTVGVEKRAQTTTLHWHAHAVASVAFTPNGAYLLSGGEESVLVIWQLHTGKKEFVPRVGAPINSIAVARGGQSEEYMLALADASFTFIGATTLKVSRSYSRIKLNPEASYSGLPAFSSTPLAIHSATSTLILPSSHPSSLQTYAPSTSTLIGELEVSPTNRVSRRDEAPIEPSRVECAVISPSAEWMATIDSREGDEAFRGEVFLKIWWWNPKTEFWTLNTRIDRPHGLERVTSVAFSPEAKERLALQLVTTGDDGTVKVWRLRSKRGKDVDVEESWVTRSAWAFRGERPRHACWSPDGSLLCVTMGPSANLYDASSNVLRRVLTFPNCNTFSSAQFIGRSGRYLAVVSVWDVVLWDLPTQSVLWHLKNPWPIDKILCHPRDDNFALLHCSSISPTSRHHTTPVAMFHPSSSLPYKKCAVPFGFLNVVWYPGTSASHLDTPSFSFVGITNDHSVVLFGDDISSPVAEGSRANAVVGGAALRKTLFQDIFGASAFANFSHIPPSVDFNAMSHPPSSGNDIGGLFDAPAYLMPPIESLFEPLMDTFLKSRRKEDDKPIAEGNEHQDDDVEMAGQSDDEPVIAGERRERVVNQEEMDMFVKLFHQTKVSLNQVVALKAPEVVPPKVNGKHHPTPSNPKVNGVERHSSTSRPSLAATAKGFPISASTLSDTKKHKRRRPSESS